MSDLSPGLRSACKGKSKGSIVGVKSYCLVNNTPGGGVGGVGMEMKGGGWGTKNDRWDQEVSRLF